MAGDTPGGSEPAAARSHGGHAGGNDFGPSSPNLFFFPRSLSLLRFGVGAAVVCRRRVAHAGEGVVPVEHFRGGKLLTAATAYRSTMSETKEGY